MNDDDPTEADLHEKLTHLSLAAQRCAGTAYYERRHQEINAELDRLDRIAGRVGV